MTMIMNAGQFMIMNTMPKKEKEKKRRRKKGGTKGDKK